MSTSKEYLAFVLDQLSEAEGVTYRAMMGEYLLYDRGRVAGGIYNNRFLIKPVAAARKLLPNASYELPYPGAKEMLLVDDSCSRAFLAKLFDAMYEELPVPKPKKKK